jgi:membrane associated rhomboid family serine protease
MPIRAMLRRNGTLHPQVKNCSSGNGASGAIAAVMGAFPVTYPQDRMRSLLVIFIFVTVTRIPAALLIVVWFLIQLLSAGAVANVPTGGVAYLAHVGGFIFEAVTARWFEDDPRRLPHSA